MPKQRARNRTIQAEREAQKERDRQEKMTAEREQMQQEYQKRVQAAQNVSETPKAQTPLKNDRRSSEAYAKLKKANEDV